MHLAFVSFAGLRPIDAGDSSDDEKYRRSPIIPIVIPIAMKPRDKLLSDMASIFFLILFLQLLIVLEKNNQVLFKWLMSCLNSYCLSHYSVRYNHLTVNIFYNQHPLVHNT